MRMRPLPDLQAVTRVGCPHHCPAPIARAVEEAAACPSGSEVAAELAPIHWAASSSTDQEMAARAWSRLDSAAGSLTDQEMTAQAWPRLNSAAGSSTHQTMTAQAWPRLNSAAELAPIHWSAAGVPA